MASKCERCKYRSAKSKSDSEVTCNYILITGHRRGCPAKNCAKFEEGEMIKIVIDPSGRQRFM